MEVVSFIIEVRVTKSYLSARTYHKQPEISYVTDNTSMKLTLHSTVIHSLLMNFSAEI